jgi:hypothetical protein
MVVLNNFMPCAGEVVRVGLFPAGCNAAVRPLGAIQPDNFPRARHIIYFAFTRLVRALRAGLPGFPGAWRRCRTLVPALPDYKGSDALYGYNFSEWNKPFFALRLALYPENRTLQPVQLRNLG